jgi:hypothetical protein
MWIISPPRGLSSCFVDSSLIEIIHIFGKSLLCSSLPVSSGSLQQFYQQLSGHTIILSMRGESMDISGNNARLSPSVLSMDSPRVEHGQGARRLKLPSSRKKVSIEVPYHTATSTFLRCLVFFHTCKIASYLCNITQLSTHVLMYVHTTR